jgi:SAM-dependent methyltransferase
MNAITNMTTPDRRWNVEQTSYWSGLSLSYDSFYTNRWSQLENEWVERRLRFLGELGEQPAILDLGCGTGLGASLASRWTSLARYIGVDIAPEMARLTQRTHAVETRVGAMDELDWVLDSSVDAAICLFSTASFVESPKRLFDEVSRVLRPGGKAYLSTLGRDLRPAPHEVRFRTRGHQSDMNVPARRFRPKHLRTLAQGAGLTVDAIEGMNSLSGIFDVPILWQVGRTMGRLAPITSHLLDIRCSKPEGTDR